MDSKTWVAAAMGVAALFAHARAGAQEPSGSRMTESARPADRAIGIYRFADWSPIRKLTFVTFGTATLAAYGASIGFLVDSLAQKGEASDLLEGRRADVFCRRGESPAACGAAAAKYEATLDAHESSADKALIFFGAGTGAGILTVLFDVLLWPEATPRSTSVGVTPVRQGAVMGVSGAF